MSSLRAPVALEALVAVANTRHGPEAKRPLAPGPAVRIAGGLDRLRDPREAARFLEALGVAVPPGAPAPEDRRRLKMVRDAVRALAEGDEGGHRRRTHRLVGPVTLRIESGRLRAAAGGWPGFVDGLAVTLLELLPHADRLKVCENPACGWVFIDRTRNSSQVWCRDQLCADRLRIRRHRRASRTKRH
ncbi:MAG TPA: CGNR zinc finger domain-containing protein [Solirubrobacteraceae bacterium]|nr:CGNR zinc finger domain-containing protein [Solirubrobacteraceae bacterium]